MGMQDAGRGGTAPTVPSGTPTALPNASSRAAQQQAAVRARAARDMDVLYEVGKILSGPADQGRLLAPVLAILSTFVQLRYGVVAMLAEPEEPLDEPVVNPYVIAATATQEKALPPRPDLLPPTVANLVFRTGIAFVCQNVASELPRHEIPPFVREARGRVALMAAPIEVFGTSRQVLGLLCVYRFEEETTGFGMDSDLRLVSMIAKLIGQAIRFRRMIETDRARLILEANTFSKAMHASADEPATTQHRAASASALPDIVGDSPAIQAVSERIRKVARTRSTVLLRGESGTGKELFAQAIHRLSDRKAAPFVKVNCAALSENLLESELFGHEKGAFTGAQGQKKGRFELADGGTLFLDEIGEISPAFQAKLLRALQEGEFERVGGTQTIRVDVRLVTATNKNLEEAVARGTFRADLYFRICVVPIELPPLRERPGDIPHLAETFLARFNEQNGTTLRFADNATDTLCGCYFPGNVRELENCVNRVASLAPGPEIHARDLACAQDACMSSKLWSMKGLRDAAPIGGLAVPERRTLPVLNNPPPTARPAGCPVDGPAGTPAPRTRRDPRQELMDAMEQSGWVQAKAARLLGLTPRQIGYALKKHDIPIKRF